MAPKPAKNNWTLFLTAFVKKNAGKMAPQEMMVAAAAAYNKSGAKK